MSTTIDNRIVNLGFNNTQFEAGTKQSVASLEALKKGLNLTDAAKNLDNLQAKGKAFNLNSIAENVGHISSSFSAFGIVGFTVLKQLTEAAIAFGQKLLSAVMGPIKQGFAEYETQINAIQTILANTESKGTTIDDVSAALAQLNTYADKTIYNFTQMAKNIGTFTAAGIDLETSVSAIKGIANLAAVSGSNSEQASTAMYQLSQALAAGSVKLMDWNSVVNAGMGGEIFKNALIETARVNGVAIDDLLEQHGTFRETLSEGWITSDILTQTLAKFTGDLNADQLRTIGYTEEQIVGILRLGEMANDAATKIKTITQLTGSLNEAIVSGFAQSWQIIIGDFNEAKLFLTEISDTLGPIIQASSDARNKILSDWSKLGGRETMINALRYAFEALLSVVKPIYEAFKQIFPKEFTGLDLAKITMNIAAFAKTLILSGENADRVKRIFAGIFAVFSILRDVVVNLMDVFFGLAGAIPLTLDGVLEFFARIGDFLVGLKDGIDVSEGFRIAIAKIAEVFAVVKVWFAGFIASVTVFVDIFKAKVAEIGAWLSGMFSGIDTGEVGDFFDKIGERFQPFGFLVKGVALLVGGMIALLVKAKPTLLAVGEIILKFVSGLGSMIADGIKNLDFNSIFDTLNTGILAALVLAVTKFMSSGTGVLDQLGGIFGGLTGLLDGVRGSLEAWQQNLKSKTLLTIAIAIGVLAASLVVLSLIDSKKLTFALAAITGLMLNLMGAMAAFSKFGGATLASLALIAIAASLLIMAKAMSVLSDIDPDDMGAGIVAIYKLMAGLVIFSKFMSTGGLGLVGGAIGLVAFAVSLRVLAGAVKFLGELDPLTLTNGLIGVGVMLAEIAVFMKLVDGAGVGPGAGLGLLIITGAILILSVAVERFGELDTGVMQKGLIALGVVLTELALFTQLTGDGDMIATALGMTILAAAMFLLVEVISRLGELDTEVLTKGLTAMGGALLAIGVAVKLFPPTMLVSAAALVVVAGALYLLSKVLEDMGKMSWEVIGKGLGVLAVSLLILGVALTAMTGTIVGSAALLIAAAALLILTPVLTTLGKMKISELVIAMLALSAVFVILGVAGALMTPVVPTLLALGIAMQSIGAGMALFGVGLLSFSTGLSVLAVSGAAGAIALVAVVGTLLGLIPLIIQVLADSLIVLATGIIAATPVVGEAVLGLLLELLRIIIEIIPPLEIALTDLLLAIIRVIVAVTPDLVAAVLLLLTTLLQSLADSLPDIIQAGYDILLGLLKGIADNIGEVLITGYDIIIAVIAAITEKIPDIIQAGWDLIVSFIEGMADGIDENMVPLMAAVTHLITSIIEGLVKGVVELGPKFIASIVQLAKDAIAAAIDIFISDSPSKVFTDIGASLPQGLVVGVKKFAGRVRHAVENLGEDAISSMKNALSRVRDVVDIDLDLAPRIRPVIDLTDVRSGGREIDKLFRRRRINILPAVAASAITAGNMVRHGPIGERVREPGVTYSFTQNNTSPKALSRLDIYRQTRNQLLTLKGVTGQ